MTLIIPAEFDEKSVGVNDRLHLWIKYCFRKAEKYFYLPPNKYSNAYERQYKNKEGCIVKYDNSIHPNCIKNKLYEYQ